MATWIVHLRVAESLLGTIDELDRCQFLVGNLAPDSGLPDEGWYRFKPPHEVTHFLRPDRKKAKWPVKDLEFYRKYLSILSSTGEDKKKYSFHLGYFFHLVVDNLWNYHVIRPTEKQYSAQFDENPQFMWGQVKRDWYDLDFVYLKEHPECIFWKLLQECECNEQYLDFLPLEATRQRIEWIRAWYQNEDEIKRRTKRRPFIYLSAEMVDKFVEWSSRQTRDIYDHLNKHTSDVSSCYSILELQPGSEGIEETE